MKNYIVKSLMVLLVTVFASCEGPLEEKPFDQLSPVNSLTSEEGLEALLSSAYGNMQVHRFGLITMHYLEEGTSDLFFETGGGQAALASLIQDFTFDSQHNWINNAYNDRWNSIRDVNLYLDNVDNIEFKNVDKSIRIAEARFIRAYEYYLLTKWFGEVALVATSTPELYPTNTPIDELNTFIETELREVADALPVSQEMYRANKGAALGVLTKLYLNTQQWEKCAATAKEIMDLGVYELHPDYTTLFSPDFEDNKEFIFVLPMTRAQAGMGTEWLALSLPPGHPEPGANFAAQFRYYDDFVNSFDSNDNRKDLIITEYVRNGATVQLLGNDDSRSLKFLDPSRIGADGENDFPMVRYADILLSRAESLNELNGPNAESISLINEVRSRAGNDLYLLVQTDFTKETLRNHILAERGWEFYSEVKRRSDLLRHGKFLELAEARGKSPKSYQVLFPIPQNEIIANKNLKQNGEY